MLSVWMSVTQIFRISSSPTKIQGNRDFWSSPSPIFCSKEVLFRDLSLWVLNISSIEHPTTSVSNLLQYLTTLMGHFVFLIKHSHVPAFLFCLFLLPYICKKTLALSLPIRKLQTLVRSLLTLLFPRMSQPSALPLVHPRLQLWTSQGSSTGLTPSEFVLHQKPRNGPWTPDADSSVLSRRAGWAPGSAIAPVLVQTWVLKLLCFPGALLSPANLLHTRNSAISAEPFFASLVAAFWAQHPSQFSHPLCYPLIHPHILLIWQEENRGQLCKKFCSNQYV